MCVCVSERTKSLVERYVNISARPIDGNYTWESAHPQFSRKFFFVILLERKCVCAISAHKKNATDKMTGRKRERQHKLCMRIQSQTTHLNTYIVHMKCKCAPL